MALQNRQGGTGSGGWTRKAPAIAGLYWVLVVSAFFTLRYWGFDMTGAGYTAMSLLTAPWSLFALLALAAVEALPYGATVLAPLNSPAGTFILFPLACGGLNVVLILTVGSTINRKGKVRR